MKKIFVLFFLFFFSCSKEIKFELGERQYKKLKENLKKIQDKSLKAKEIKDFLEKYPDSYEIGYLTGLLIEYEDPLICESFFKNLMEKAKTDFAKEDFKFALIELYKKTKERDKILEVFKSFKKPLNFNNYFKTINALIEINDFNEALKITEDALDYLEKEQKKKEIKGSNIENLRRIYNRRFFALNFLKGKAYHGLKDYEKALFFYNEALKFQKPSFVGTYLYDFNLNYARLLKETGKREEAILRVLPDVIYEKNEENFRFFEETYVEVYGSKEGIEEFLKLKKEEFSPSAIDFNLKNYKGEVFNFDEVSKGKVALLTFWFPT